MQPVQGLRWLTNVQCDYIVIKNVVGSIPATSDSFNEYLPLKVPRYQRTCLKELELEALRRRAT